MKEKIDLPKDLEIMRSEVIEKWKWIYDPAPWVIRDIYGEKMAGVVLKEQFKLRAETARLEAQYFKNIAKLVG